MKYFLVARGVSVTTSLSFSLLGLSLFCVNQKSVTAFTTANHPFHFSTFSSLTPITQDKRSLVKMSFSSSAPSSKKKDIVMSQDDLQQVKALISKAISIGAPAYNTGDIQGCAQIYKSTASKIFPLLSTPLKNSLEETITLQSNNDNDMEAAWAIRRQFDTIMEYQPPFLPSSWPTTTNNQNYKLEQFTSPQQLPQEPWNVMDNVMGGVSQGSWVSETNTFVGTTSLANNGGFASLRWRFPTLQNWCYAKGIYLRNIKHSQPMMHTFRLLLKDSTCEQIRGANFKIVFANPNQDGDNNDGSIIYIPFTAFNQMEQMGRQLSGPIFNPAAVSEIGIMAIKPSVVGDFELTIPEWGLYLQDDTAIANDDSKTATATGKDIHDVTVKVAQVAGRDNEIFHCFEIRRKVFIEEQQVPKDVEVDGKDDEAIHILAYGKCDKDNKTIPYGTARLLVKDGSAKIGRVAVLKEYRSQGVGRQIMEYSLQHLKTVVKCQKVILGAQTHAIPFYESLGFAVIKGSEEYMDAGNVPHLDMEQIFSSSS